MNTWGIWYSPRDNGVRQDGLRYRSHDGIQGVIRPWQDRYNWNAGSDGHWLSNGHSPTLDAAMAAANARMAEVRGWV